MDIKIILEAGYKYDDDDSRELIQNVIWDDNYILLKIGEQRKPMDEYLTRTRRNPTEWKWNVYFGPSPEIILAGYCVHRRLKPGLIKVKVKEE